jgi:pimeloyl-ACP methyl ester carboxylesterase
VRKLVYVDAMVPLPGEGWGDAHAPEIVAARRAAAAAHDNALPPPDPADFGLAGADRDWLLRRQVPHPFGMYRVPLDYDGNAVAALPRLFIDCNRPAYPTIDAMRQRVRSLPGWQVVEMATGHCPMVTQPETLVQHLLTFVAG